jgi:hypothetical protein
VKSQFQNLPFKFNLQRYIVDAAVPVWVNEVCGDGVCSEPFEFLAYGRFGCRSDCGVNANLTTVLLQVRADFRDDLYSPLAGIAPFTTTFCCSKITT